MRLRYLTLAFALFAAPAAAQSDMSNVEIQVEKLAPGVAVLFGAGGNIGLSYGEDANLIIDDQFAALTEKIVTAIASLDPDPVRFVINTHWHFDHTGGNENFGKADAVIVAHENVRKRISTDQFMAALKQSIPAAPGIALPVVTFGDSVTIHINGDTLDVVHVANAHTDGDSIVHWQKANVIHMGDIFFHRVSLPFIDLGSGGSIDGMIAGANRGLEIANATTKVIPGHGPMAARDDLAAYRDMLVDIREKVAAGIKGGKSLEQIRSEKPTGPYGMSDGFVKPDQFVEVVFNSLNTPP